MKTSARKGKKVQEPALGWAFLSSVERWWEPARARRQALVDRKQKAGRLSLADEAELDLLEDVCGTVWVVVGGRPHGLHYLDEVRQDATKSPPNASARSDGRLARLAGISVNSNPFHPVEARFLWSSWNIGWVETDFDPFAPKYTGGCGV